MPHHFNSAQNTRENLLAQLKTMNEEKISVLKNELAHEHQKLISALSSAQTDEQEKYAILIIIPIPATKRSPAARLRASLSPKTPCALF